MGQFSELALSNIGDWVVFKCVIARRIETGRAKIRYIDVERERVHVNFNGFKCIDNCRHNYSDCISGMNALPCQGFIVDFSEIIKVTEVK